MAHKLTPLENLDKFIEGSPPITNKVRSYILPAFLSYGTDFIRKMSEFSFVAVGLMDMLKPELFDDERIGFLIDAKNSKHLDFSILSPAYVTDYYFGELLYGPLHMVVLKLPGMHRETVVKHFRRSEYSKMYKNATALFTNPYNGKHFSEVKDKCLAVCTRDPEYRKVMEERLGVSIRSTAELDTKINPFEEIFNYKEI